MIFKRWRRAHRTPATSRPPHAEAELIDRFRLIHGRLPNFTNPTTFTELLSRRLVHLCRYGNPLLTRLTDKLAVRSYVADRIGDTYLTPLFWQGADPDRIPFGELPPDYMIKTNHGSGGHILVSGGQVDPAGVRAHFAKILAENYSDYAHEYQYRDIEPMVFVESVIDDGVEGGPINYRFYAFDGRVELLKADTESNIFYAFYDRSWTSLDLVCRADVAVAPIARPDSLETMLRVASALSEGLDFVRVDLYATGKKVVFGEMTFTPMGGYLKFSDDGWDRRLGAIWRSAQAALGDVGFEAYATQGREQGRRIGTRTVFEACMSLARRGGRTSGAP